MRMPILLVSTYELGHQPLSLAQPLAVLRSAGFDPVAVDTSVTPLTDEAIGAARLVAIAVPMHTALRLGTAVAERVRRVNPDAHIAFFGLYATLNADHLLDGRGDSVCSGEIEAALLALAETLEHEGDPAGVPGIGTRQHPAEPILTPLPDPLRELVPVRESLPELKQYAGMAQDGIIVRAGAIEATRGCHHTCLHCPIPPIYGGTFVVVPRPVVVADARQQIALGARHLTFTDPDFFNGPGHGLRIMRELREEYPWLTFDATIKVQHLLEHASRLAELAELGCIFVVSAVESLDDEVLRQLDKGHTRADIERALALLDEVGIAMRPSLLPFTPWETLAGYRAIVQWVAEQDLATCVDPVMLAIRLLLPPGSSLLAAHAEAPWLGALDAANFTYRWAHPDPRMDELHRRVSVIAEDAANINEAPQLTLQAIWDAAHEVAGDAAPPLPAPVKKRPAAPGLTESWFC